MAFSTTPRKHTRSVSNTYNGGGFLTAHIIDQPYGEMNPKFIEEIFHDLEETIYVIDQFKRKMVVQFNGSNQHPMIVYGWQKMRSFFNFTGNKLMLMTYVGKCTFQISIFPEELNLAKLPSYHTYRTFNNDLTSFDVTLTAYLATGSQLTMKKDFAAYIRSTGYNMLTLFGPSGDEIECSVLIREKSTKIGEGWKEFCEMNGFIAGDVLNFKFINKAENNLMKVTQIEIAPNEVMFRSV